MTVEEIERRLGPLTDDQVKRLRDHERQNQNRKTLIDRYDQKLRASSQGHAPAVSVRGRSSEKERD